VISTGWILKVVENGGFAVGGFFIIFLQVWKFFVGYFNIDFFILLKIKI